MVFRAKTVAVDIHPVGSTLPAYIVQHARVLRQEGRGSFLRFIGPRASGNGLLTLLPFICYDGFVGRKVLQGKSPRLLRTRGTARQFFKLRGPSRALPSLRFPSATCCTKAEVVQMTNIELLAFLISIAGLMLSAYALGKSNRR